MALPALLSPEKILDRLQIIFPQGTPNRNYCVRKLAANTIFVALYVGAIEGTGVLFGPKHVYRMTGKQALLTDFLSRNTYATEIVGAAFQPPGKRWYSDNTREPIRDETLREGLIAVGAVGERRPTAFPPTSSKPRYALYCELWGAIRSSSYRCEISRAAATAWQASALNQGTLARIALIRHGAAAGGRLCACKRSRAARRVA